MHPIAFRVGPYPIRYAGLLYVVAVLGALLYARHVARQRQWDSEAVLPGVAIVVAAAYLGARLHGVLNGLSAGDELGRALQAGALSFFGGLAVGSVALVAYLRWARLPMAVADELALFAPVVYAIFRLGCFLNGDDYGVQTSLPWGITFPYGAPPTGDRVHPVQLYEVLLMVPVWLLLRRRSYTTLPDGARSFDLCVLFGTERFLVEFLRPAFNDAEYLAASQWLSLVLIAAGVVGRWRLRPTVFESR